MIATLASDFLAREFTSVTRLAAGMVSICGVVLVSQPWQEAEITGSRIVLSNSQFTKPQIPGSMLGRNYTIYPGTLAASSIPFPHQFATLDRITAVGAALVGVAGGATAYVAMMFIGDRAHSVVTVCHFATWTLVINGFSLLFTGTDYFRMPTLLEWILLAFLGLSSLLLQMLVAASLQGEGSTLALNMTYTQIVFSLILDKVVWGISPNRISLIGGGLILSSVIAVTTKEQGDITPYKGYYRREIVDRCQNACETELMLSWEDNEVSRPVEMQEGQERVGV